jgi:membrane protein YdbS with pleckstrin-like domain
MANPFQLDADEQVELDVRRHWINILPVWLSSAAMVVAAVALSFVFGLFRDNVAKFLPSVLSTIILVVLIALALLIFLTGTWVYRQNRLVLTNKHLIRVEQDGLFSRKVSQLALGRVQDVNGVRRGLIATVLNFGSVEVQSAGEDEEFVFIQMPNPSGLADQLMKAHDRYAGGQPDGTE